MGLLVCAALAVADGWLIGSRSGVPVAVGGFLAFLLVMLLVLLLGVGRTATSTLPVAPLLLGGLSCTLLGLLLAAGGSHRYLLLALGAGTLLTVLSAVTDRPGRRRTPERLAAADREDLLDAYPSTARH